VQNVFIIFSQHLNLDNFLAILVDIFLSLGQKLRDMRCKMLSKAFLGAGIINGAGTFP
jgi:hypothetical protein